MLYRESAADSWTQSIGSMIHNVGKPAPIQWCEILNTYVSLLVVFPFLSNESPLKGSRSSGAFFWALWCLPCNIEQVSKLQQERPLQGGMREG